MSVFSHIVRQRLSNEAENVATEALAFIVNDSDGARSGLLKLVRGLSQGIPDLQFATQTTVEGGRPDMAGSDGASTFVFIENKFWAGLTDQQPVEYVRALAAEVGIQGVLLFVAPAARATSVWGELVRRLHLAGVICEEATSPPGVLQVARTSLGPSMALTSWTQLLTALTLEAAGDTAAVADIDQLRALCELTDRTAWKPFSPEVLTSQDLPATILQLGELTDEIVRQGVARGIMDVTGLTAASTAERIGRYAKLVAPEVGIWIGAHFSMWRDHGATPLWVTFSNTEWGRGTTVKAPALAWARANEHPFADARTSGFAIGLHLPANTELDGAVSAALMQIEQMAKAMIAG